MEYYEEVHSQGRKKKSSLFGKLEYTSSLVLIQTLLNFRFQWAVRKWGFDHFQFPNRKMPKPSTNSVADLVLALYQNIVSVDELRKLEEFMVSCTLNSERGIGFYNLIRTELAKFALYRKL